MVISRLDKIENFIASTSYNNKKKLAKLTVKSGNYNKSERKAVYKALVATPLVLDSKGNPVAEMREFIRRYDRNRAERRKRTRHKMDIPYLKEILKKTDSKLHLVELSNRHLKDDGLKYQVGNNTLRPQIPPTDLTRGTVEKKHRITKENQETNKFICSIEKLDELLEVYETFNQTSSKGNLRNIFCSAGRSLDESQYRKQTKILSYFNECRGKYGSFIKLKQDGLGKSGCNVNVIKTSCRDRISKETVHYCKQILSKEFSLVYVDGQLNLDNDYFQFLDQCIENLNTGASGSQPSEILGINNSLREIKGFNCSNRPETILKVEDSINKLETFNQYLLDSDKYSLSQVKKYVSKEPKLNCEKLKSATVLIEGRLATKIKAMNNIEKQLPPKEQAISSWSIMNIKAWLAHNSQLIKLKHKIMSCEAGSTSDETSPSDGIN